jgi:type IV pilus biogenesis protein PilP
MIEIEKKLGELEKVRNERAQEKSSKSASNLAAAIPASALTPPPAPAASASASSLTSAFRVAEPRPRAASTLEVSRIVGSQGRYSATVMEGGAARNVSVGDKVGGATVRAITAQAVTVDDGGETRTLRVKNVDTIFSAMR